MIGFGRVLVEERYFIVSI